MKKVLIITITSIVVIIASLVLYSHFLGVKGLNVNEYTLKNKIIPDSFNGIKVIHFTDLHYGSTVNKKDLKHLINTINSYNPDIVVFTGDLLSNKKVNEKELINALNQIDSTIGKYYVSGNKNDIKIFNKTNFIKLDDTNNLIYYGDNEPINLYGYQKEMPEINSDYFTIGLTHNPSNVKKMQGNIALAGYTHRGQVVIPFIGGIIKADKGEYYRDYHYKVDKKDLYISNGIGTNKYQFRLNNKPSINVYRLINK